MNKQLRLATRSVLAILVTTSTSSSMSSPTHNAIAIANTPIVEDATLHVRELTIPPSDYWSLEFKTLYARLVEQMRRAAGQQRAQRPARYAPKAEWDALYEAQVRALAEPLVRDLMQYSVAVEDTNIAGVHVGIISPKGGVTLENQHRVLINLHGGGFVDFKGLTFGELESVPVASLGQIRVITVDYRQSPDYQYPAASEDIEAVYRELLNHYTPGAIGIFGCSSGGILTAQAIAWFQAKGLPRPGAVGILCAAPPTGRPGPSTTQSANTWNGGWIKSGDSKMWGLGVIPEVQSRRVALPGDNATDWYMEDADVGDVKAFPGASDSVLAAFPPTLLLSGTRTVEFSPTVVAHARLLKLGVDSSLYLIEGGWHAVHVIAVGTPEARDANAYIARWFLQHLAR